VRPITRALEALALYTYPRATSYHFLLQWYFAKFWRAENITEAVKLGLEKKRFLAEVDKSL
jgi:hypothetical protein